MITELALTGAYLLEGRYAADFRGGFRKVVDWPTDGGPDEARTVDEVAVSSNDVAGTLRGLHFQAEPHAQTKIVWVAAGAVHDVVVDLRAGSPTYGRWIAEELSAENNRALYLPAGVAHGFQTLVDHTSVVYLMSGAYVPESARTLRWDDPTLGVSWPLDVARISDADRDGHSWGDL